MLAYTDPFVKVGTVVACHGFKGIVKVRFDEKERLKKNVPFLFLDYSPSPVPFRIEQMNHQSGDLFLIKFKKIETEGDAKNILFKELFLPESDLKRLQNLNYSLSTFQVIHQRLGAVGTVKEVIEGKQPLLCISGIDGYEFLVPLVHEFMISMDEKEKKIILNFPEELLRL